MGDSSSLEEPDKMLTKAGAARRQNGSEEQGDVPHNRRITEVKQQILNLMGEFPGRDTSHMSIEHVEGSPESNPSGRRVRRKLSENKLNKRGPMDEMRLLVRILLKFFPHSADLAMPQEEYGGGNRLTGDQIRSYLEKLLGPEAPQPEWGIPAKWNGYIAQLFSWAIDKNVTPGQIESVASRQPGRSWEIDTERLGKFGLHPAAWPLPISKQQIQEIENSEEIHAIRITSNRKPQSLGKALSALREKDFAVFDEAELWNIISHALTVAHKKLGTSNDQIAAENARLVAKEKFEEILLTQSQINQIYQQYLMPIDQSGYLSMAHPATEEPVHARQHHETQTVNEETAADSGENGTSF
eukprot:jgi/Picsp_1/5282/NSC_02644-R1_hypothetical protein CHLNCDRAFT_142040 [Chlorella variabilis]